MHCAKVLLVLLHGLYPWPSGLGKRLMQQHKQGCKHTRYIYFLCTKSILSVAVSVPPLTVLLLHSPLPSICCDSHPAMLSCCRHLSVFMQALLSLVVTETGAPICANVADSLLQFGLSVSARFTCVSEPVCVGRGL